MRNRKGQALVEFILILPVFLLMLMGLIDLGNILYHEYQLENKLDYVVDLYQDKKMVAIEDYLNKEKITMDVNQYPEYSEIILKESTRLSTPILKEVIGSNHEISAKRTIYETE